MLGEMTVLGRIHAITEAELHVPAVYETRLLYLCVAAEPSGGFGIWEVDLTRLRDLDELNGKRLHIRWTGEAFEDDTLGTDNTGVDDVTDLNYLQVEGRGYGYREVQVDFTRIQGRHYRVEAHLVLMTDGEKPADDFTATAEFTVDADEHDPFAGSR